MKSTLMLATSLAGAAGAALAAPHSTAGPVPTAAPIWAEAQDNADYRRCAALLPNNPCVREVFYLHGSVGELRRSCGPTGVLNSGDEIFAIDLTLFYPKTLFPKGPQCGKLQSYNSPFDDDYFGRQFIRLSSKEYGPVCETCIVDGQTLVIDDDQTAVVDNNLAHLPEGLWR